MLTKRFAFFSIAISLLSLGLYSCSKDTKTQRASLNLPADPYEYMGVNSDKATLGRVLFYDKNLSINGQVSCGSCHKQGLAFADSKRFSTGFHGDKATRNTPPIQNISFGDEQALFWDGRERNLQAMSVQPIFHHMEMGVFDEEIILQRINSRPFYKELLDKAFQTEEVNVEQIGLALSSFIAAIRSNQTEFDMNTFPIFNMDSKGSLANEGRTLFFSKYNCGTCHNLFSPHGYDVSFQELNAEMVNIGLDVNYTDKGLGALTKKSSDDGRFKIPNLRNVALTAPYMHDGRFSTLEEVIEHYSTGVQNNANLDFRLKNEAGQPSVLHITEYEKKAIIAFLQTLTDYEMVSDKRFSDPFQY